MNDYEGIAEFIYNDGEQQDVQIVWHSAYSNPPFIGPDGSGGRVKRAATFAVTEYLRRPDELVTISFDGQDHRGFYNDPKPGRGTVTYTFHSQ